MKIKIWMFTSIAAALAGPALAQDARDGEELYRHHCAVCHGIDAMGDGPMAGVLLIAPADLTLLQADNNDIFPTEKVVRRIDGRDPLVSHGSDMPVYGLFFQGEDTATKTPGGQPILTSKPIVDLLVYLKSVQNI